MKIALCAPIDIHALARSIGRDTAGVAPGLGSTATTPLTIELLRRGHEVTVYTLSNDLPQPQLHEWDGLRVFVGPSRAIGSARNFYRMEMDSLKRAIRADAPAFVHAHWTYEFGLAALNSGIPTIITIHDLPWNVLKHFRDRCRTVRLLMAYLVAAKGRSFTAVSPDAVQHFQRWLRPVGKVQLIPNFLQNAVFALGRTSTPAIERPFTFITLLQGWSRRKNASCALEAFQLVRKTLPATRLLMVGTGYEAGGPAQAWASSKGLTEGVVFQGVMEHEAMLRFALEQADVLVHPSLDEAFSVASLEAMALKKPVIAGERTPGVQWVLDHGRVGSLVDVRDPESVAAAMRQLASDEVLRKSMAELAFEKAWGHFRADVVVPQYEALYRDFQAGLNRKVGSFEQAGERA